MTTKTPKIEEKGLSGELLRPGIQDNWFYMAELVEEVINEDAETKTL